MQRVVHGPDKEFLTSTEAASWLTISASTFLRLVKLGVAPRGAKVGGKQKWTWMDVVMLKEILQNARWKKWLSRAKEVVTARQGPSQPVRARQNSGDEKTPVESSQRKKREEEQPPE